MKKTHLLLGGLGLILGAGITAVIFTLSANAASTPKITSDGTTIYSVETIAGLDFAKANEVLAKVNVSPNFRTVLLAKEVAGNKVQSLALSTDRLFIQLARLEKGILQHSLVEIDKEGEVKAHLNHSDTLEVFAKAHVKIDLDTNANGDLGVKNGAKVQEYLDGNGNSNPEVTNAPDNDMNGPDNAYACMDQFVDLFPGNGGGEIRPMFSNQALFGFDVVNMAVLSNAVVELAINKQVLNENTEVDASRLLEKAHNVLNTKQKVENVEGSIGASMVMLKVKVIPMALTAATNLFADGSWVEDNQKQYPCLQYLSAEVTQTAIDHIINNPELKDLVVKAKADFVGKISVLESAGQEKLRIDFAKSVDAISKIVASSR